MRYAANLGITMVLARQLPPEQFGLLAMAVTFTGLLGMFKDAGMEPALLNRQSLGQAELASLASLNFCHGLLLAAGCAALGPLLALLYGEPQLASCLLLTACAFVFYGLDVQPGAELLRTHRFRTHAVIETIATLVGLGVTLLLAWRGSVRWALFATEPVTAVCLFAGHAWAVRWRPRFSLAWGAARQFVRFGGSVLIQRTLGHIGRNVDNLILGLAAGATPLAFYNKAFRLINLPQECINWPLSRLAMPILAQTRDRPEDFVRAFRHFNLSSMALGLPAATFLLVAADEMVAIVYGAQWTPVSPLLRLMGVMGLCNTFLLATGWVYVAMGTVDRQIRWEFVNVAMLTAAFLVGVRWGPAGIAVAASVGYAGLRVPALLYCFRGTPLRLRDMLAVLWRPLLASAIGAGGVLLARALIPGSTAPLLTVARDGCLFGAGYVLGWVLVPGWKNFLRHELRRPAPAA